MKSELFTMGRITQKETSVTYASSADFFAALDLQKMTSFILEKNCRN